MNLSARTLLLVASLCQACIGRSSERLMTEDSNFGELETKPISSTRENSEQNHPSSTNSERDLPLQEKTLNPLKTFRTPESTLTFAMQMFLDMLADEIKTSAKPALNVQDEEVLAFLSGELCPPPPAVSRLSSAAKNILFEIKVRELLGKYDGSDGTLNLARELFKLLRTYAPEMVYIVQFQTKNSKKEQKRRNQENKSMKTTTEEGEIKEEPSLEEIMELLSGRQFEFNNVVADGLEMMTVDSITVELKKEGDYVVTGNVKFGEAQLIPNNRENEPLVSITLRARIIIEVKETSTGIYEADLDNVNLEKYNSETMSILEDSLCDKISVRKLEKELSSRIDRMRFESFITDIVQTLFKNPDVQSIFVPTEPSA